MRGHRHHSRIGRANALTGRHSRPTCPSSWPPASQQRGFSSLPHDHAWPAHLFSGPNIRRLMARIGSRACQLPIPVIMSLLPRELPELYRYAKPYSLTVNFQSLHFYFSCMHSARMLRSTGKYNTDCPILSLNLSIVFE